MVALVFVYGTLTDDERVASLLDSYRFVGAATCVGLRRVDGRYPTLVPGDSVTGRLLETDDIERLDRYEGVDRGLYHRVSVSLASSLAATVSTPTASVYLGEPAALGLGSLDQYWPGTGAFSARVERYLPATRIEPINTE
mgnify:CR=1 FL=1